jgi:hypothetical protein
MGHRNGPQRNSYGSLIKHVLHSDCVQSMSDSRQTYRECVPTRSIHSIHDRSNYSSLSLSRRPAALQPTSRLLKITWWRLLNSAVLLVLGVTKIASTYLGYSTAPTNLEWIIGAMWALMYVPKK